MSNPLPDLLTVAEWLPQPRTVKCAEDRGWNACLEAIQAQRKRAMKAACSECRLWRADLSPAPSSDRLVFDVHWCPERKTFTSAGSVCDSFCSRHPVTNS